MVFSSLEFLLVFLPVFMIIYSLVPSRMKNEVLLVGSLIFYAYGEPKYILLLGVSVGLNFLMARFLGTESVRKSNMAKFLFGGAVLLDLSVLMLFKLAPAEWGLPLGISFYTFQMVSYLWDVYRGQIKAEKSFLKIATYICMFPQLVAGPIVHYDEVSKQLENPKIKLEQINDGLKVFVWGLGMKVLLADRLSLLWKELSTAGYVSLPTGLAWIGMIGYSLQIYFDFYGYSLMAIGLGRMMGYSFPQNFDIPYAAGSIRVFYKKWHITLGRWFTQYVYIPLGGSRQGMTRTIRNLCIVWFLTAMWHGIGLHFLLWGGLLCMCIVIERIVSNTKIYEKYKIWEKSHGKIGRILSVFQHIYVLLIIGITWICFAIDDLGQIWEYLGRMFGMVKGIAINHAQTMDVLGKYGWILLVAILMASPLEKTIFQKWKNKAFGMVVLTAIFWISVWYIREMGNNPFMYFRF